MLTTMTEQDWKIVLQVFQASRSRRGDKGQDDRRFLEALHYFVVHNITWRALPAQFRHGNSVWKRFWRLSRTGTFEAFFDALAAMTGRRISFRCSTPPWCEPMSRRPAQKGAKRSGSRSLTRWIFDQDSLEDRFRWPAHRISSHRW